MLVAEEEGVALPIALPTPAVSTPVALEQHYTPLQLAAAWKLSPDSVRKMMEKEPGVLVLRNDRRGVRRRHMLRIPASVADRVLRRMTVTVPQN